MKKHATIIEKARSMGSTATTKVGARRFILSHLPKLRAGLERLDRGGHFADKWGR
jgi:hypothetical protein